MLYTVYVGCSIPISFDIDLNTNLPGQQLYYSVDSYHQLVVNGRTGDENPHHAAHCFEYLRNSILCSLDMTLEGSQSTMADKTRGQAHVCRNREEAVAWIEKRRVDDLQDIVGP